MGADYWSNLGRYLFSDGYPTPATACFRVAHRLRPSDIGFLENYGAALLVQLRCSPLRPMEPRSPG